MSNNNNNIIIIIIVVLLFLTITIFSDKLFNFFNNINIKHYFNDNNHSDFSEYSEYSEYSENLNYPKINNTNSTIHNDIDMNEYLINDNQEDLNNNYNIEDNINYTSSNHNNSNSIINNIDDNDNLPAEAPFIPTQNPYQNEPVVPPSEAPIDWRTPQEKAISEIMRDLAKKKHEKRYPTT